MRFYLKLWFHMPKFMLAETYHKAATGLANKLEAR
jgi:hypothetical protein